MNKIYLVAAIIGAIIPCFFFFQFIQLNGVNLPDFISALFVNGATGGFSADLLISSFVFWVFMFQQRKMSNAPKPWLFIGKRVAVPPVKNIWLAASCHFLIRGGYGRHIEMASVY